MGLNQPATGTAKRLRGRRAERARHRLRVLPALVAVLVQAFAFGLPMAAAADTGVPGWLSASLCRGGAADDGRSAPDAPVHLICPVCYVLSAASSAVPPAAAPLALPEAAPRMLSARPEMQGPPPAGAAICHCSRAPPPAA